LETEILLWIHAHASRLLELGFLLSNLLGTFWFCSSVVVGLATWHLRRGDRAEAHLWLALGVSTYLLQEWLKLGVARPRPELWPRLVFVSSYSFPSGHALAAATFFPLLARTWTRERPREKWAARAAAAALAIFIGFGRLYLGVHWPSDVLAGWTLGCLQTATAIWIRDGFFPSGRRARGEPRYDRERP